MGSEDPPSPSAAGLDDILSIGWSTSVGGIATSSGPSDVTARCGGTATHDAEIGVDEGRADGEAATRECLLEGVGPDGTGWKGMGVIEGKEGLPRPGGKTSISRTD